MIQCLFHWHLYVQWSQAASHSAQRLFVSLYQTKGFEGWLIEVKHTREMNQLATAQSDYSIKYDVCL